MSIHAQHRYRNPLDILIEQESRTCKGCRYEFKASAFGTMVAICTYQNKEGKRRQHGKRCRNYCERIIDVKAVANAVPNEMRAKRAPCAEERITTAGSAAPGRAVEQSKLKRKTLHLNPARTKPVEDKKVQRTAVHVESAECKAQQNNAAECNAIEHCVTGNTERSAHGQL